MNLKNGILNIVTENTKLTAYMYNHYKNNVEKEINSLANEMAQLDTIKDIQPLIKLKKQIVESGKSFTSYNGNMSNYRLYGIGETLFGKIETEVYMLPSIEHGLIFYNQNWTDTSLTARASCVTFGKFRKEILQRYYETPVFEVGPYIQYASCYYSEKEMKIWKEKLGKTLLVFPMHSTDSSVLNYNCECYIKEIEKRAKDYDSVVVCVFWWNLDDSIVDAFKNKGYYIVSAGFREDPNFLRRQRALIEVSDDVISDSVGTHVGYCYKLGKRVEFVTAKTEGSHKDSVDEKEKFNIKQRENIQRIFQQESSERIDQMMDYYWGNEISLTREELKSIADINKEITIAGKYWKNRYKLVIQELLKEYEKKDLLKYRLLKNAVKVNDR